MQAGGERKSAMPYFRREEAKAYVCSFGFVQIYVLNASSSVKHLVKEQSVACFQARPLRDATQDEREMQSR